MSDLEEKSTGGEVEMARTAGEEASRHRIPVIESMIEILDLLERRPNGATIRDAVQTLEMPRSTVYRILNTLGAHGFVRRSASGSYSLGERFIALAASVAPRTPDYDLLALAQPQMERLVEQTGESCKISVISNGEILVLAALAGKHPFALSPAPGQRLPLHAGAAGKLLLAQLPADEIDRLLGKELPSYTPKTITSRKKLMAELDAIRAQGWSSDKGEQMPGVHAVAGPVRDGSGQVVAALSIPFLPNSERSRPEALRHAVIEAADAISESIAAAERRYPARNGAALD